MLPMPEATVWSSSTRLMALSLALTRRTTAARSKAGSSRSGAMCPIVVGMPCTSRSVRASPPNVRWSTKRSSGPSSAKRNRACRCFSSGAAGSSTSSWPLIPRCRIRPSESPRSSQRYLPRRRTASTRRPASRSARSWGPATWRRATRAPRSSTSATVRPSTWSARPRRTTSTSGSSGTARGGSVRLELVGVALGARFLLGAGDRALVGVADGGPRERGGLLLGDLLGAPGPDTEHVTGDDDLRREPLGVLRAVLGDGVLGSPERVAGGDLLQAGFPVQAGAQGGRLGQQGVDEVVHQLAGGVDAGGLVDRADDGLDGVGEDGVLVATAGRLLAAAEVDVVAQPQGAADVGQRPHVHHGGAQLRELPLAGVGVCVVERRGDDEPEHGVAEELQALVVRQPPGLVGVRPVRQGTPEHGLVDRAARHLLEVFEQLVDGPQRRECTARGRRLPHGGGISPGARCARRRRSGGPCRCRRTGTPRAAGSATCTGGRSSL